MGKKKSDPMPEVEVWRKGRSMGSVLFWCLCLTYHEWLSEFFTLDGTCSSWEKIISQREGTIFCTEPGSLLGEWWLFFFFFFLWLLFCLLFVDLTGCSRLVSEVYLVKTDRIQLREVVLYLSCNLTIYLVGKSSPLVVC